MKLPSTIAMLRRGAWWTLWRRSKKYLDKEVSPRFSCFVRIDTGSRGQKRSWEKSMWRMRGENEGKIKYRCLNWRKTSKAVMGSICSKRSELSKVERIEDSNFSCKLKIDLSLYQRDIWASLADMSSQKWQQLILKRISALKLNFL